MYVKNVTATAGGTEIEYGSLYKSVTIEPLDSGTVTVSYLPVYGGAAQTPDENTLTDKPIQLLNQPHSGLVLAGSDVPVRVVAWDHAGPA